MNNIGVNILTEAATIAKLMLILIYASHLCPPQELVVDLLVREDPLDSAAVLPAVLETSSHRPAHDLIKTNIVTEHHGILPPQLQNNRLKKLRASSEGLS